MTEPKYKRQAAYNRAHYVRFPLDLKPEVLEAFKAACKANGTTPTTEIKRFISNYIVVSGPTASEPAPDISRDA